MTLNNKTKRNLRRKSLIQLLNDAEKVRTALHDIRVYAMLDSTLIQELKQELLNIYIELQKLYEEVGK